MASLYSKRSKLHIDYWVNGKRVTKNLQLAATIRNRKIAEKIKAEIEKEIENLQVNSNAQNNTSADKTSNPTQITLGESLSKYKVRIAMRSKSHQVIFDVVMQRLLKFVSTESLVTEITPEHIVAFISSYMNKISNATLITYINYLKGFFNFLVDEEYITRSPVRKKDIPRRERKRIITFENDMLVDLMQFARTKDSNFYNILSIMQLTGIRPNDVLRLKVGDIDYNNEVIYLKIAKTKKEIKFPLYYELKSFLENEMSEIKQMDKEQLLFPTYSVSRLGKKFRRMKAKLGIREKHSYTLKTFRKSFATEMSGILDIQYVAYLLGHDSPNTTVKYYSDVLVNKVRDKINQKSLN